MLPQLMLFPLVGLKFIMVQEIRIFLLSYLLFLCYWFHEGGDSERKIEGGRGKGRGRKENEYVSIKRGLTVSSQGKVIVYTVRN